MRFIIFLTLSLLLVSCWKVTDNVKNNKNAPLWAEIGSTNSGGWNWTPEVAKGNR